MSNNPEISARLSGRYRLVLRNEKEGIKEDLEFDNLITSYGLWSILQGYFSGYRIDIGTGTTTPTFSDVKLANYIAQSSSSGGVTPPSAINRTVLPYWAETSYLRTFNPGIGTGIITEVGLGNQFHFDRVLSRSLIKDANGNPTSITKLADDFLDVVYTLRSDVPSEDIAFNVGINGTEVSGFMRPLRFFSSAYHAWQPFIYFPSFGYSTYASTGLLPAIHSDSQSSLTGSGAITSAATESTSVNDAANYKKRYTATWNPDKGNVTIKSIYMADHWGDGRATYGIQFNTPIVKTATQRFRFSFDMIVNRG